MEEQIKQLAIRIDYLEKLISLYQQNMDFNIGLSWAIIGVVTTVLALAAAFLIKLLVEKLVGEKLKNIDFRDTRQMGEILILEGNAKVEVIISKLKKTTLGMPNRLEVFASASSKTLIYQADIKAGVKSDIIIISLKNFNPSVDGHLRWVMTEYFK